MKTSRARKLQNRKRRIQRRLRVRPWPPQDRPMFTAGNIVYELADKTRGLAAGGIGAMHLLARRTGLVEAIDEDLHLLKMHRPYHESDHVLNIAYNLLAGGTCLEDLELRRNDEVWLDALGAQRIPDPTTAGDFCRRFEAADVAALMRAINRTRLKLWARQPEAFRDQAIIEADGVMVPTSGQCKQGMDIAYDGTWGYHPLLISLANTAEPLFVFNRSANRPSHDGAAGYFDQAVGLCREAGFKKILLRGDTDFTQTRELDRWDEDQVEFVFGMDARPNLVEHAETLENSAWQKLERPAKYAVQTTPRAKPDNVKEEVVRRREFENIRLRGEDVADCSYQPAACKKIYRLVIVRKQLAVEKGQQTLFEEYRYFFYLSNDYATPTADLVFSANERCNQENLIAQLKGAVRALAAPVDALVSNWAYMVMASLAWTLKAWLALSLPEGGRWADQHRAEKQKVLKMEFKRFCHAFLKMPCQIVRQGRRVIYRLLAWNPWQHVFLRAVDALRVPLRC